MTPYRIRVRPYVYGAIRVRLLPYPYPNVGSEKVVRAGTVTVTGTVRVYGRISMAGSAHLVFVVNTLPNIEYSVN